MKHRSSKIRFIFTGQNVSGMSIEGMQDQNLETDRYHESAKPQLPIGADILDGPILGWPSLPGIATPEEVSRFKNALDMMDDASTPTAEDVPLIPPFLQ